MYLLPELFEEELGKIFHRGWVYVGHASEAPQPGDYRSTWIGRQSVIMTLAWMRHEDLAQFLVPAHHRWGDEDGYDTDKLLGEPESSRTR